MEAKTLAGVQRRNLLCVQQQPITLASCTFGSPGANINPGWKCQNKNIFAFDFCETILIDFWLACICSKVDYRFGCIYFQCQLM